MLSAQNNKKQDITTDGEAVNNGACTSSVPAFPLSGAPCGLSWRRRMEPLLCL
ncbi:hypothetical protein COCCADRAFT_100192 [Bipolaris zeicola 26-R-13]|uniref:Uncharacterized protein n=1 Tax=Cochliobolus carbonum (strain 26-R-13) TaxID=930089 RepID=W6YKI9_COCC2|nr:uncharacterized protein COCCADRAFT_100192 [Bipolaris zeicola 26-R-13]EUC31871.1 hypothetical protein COCCADRAFT_100192 [Bipolaris zeicola 26-R-13]